MPVLLDTSVITTTTHLLELLPDPQGAHNRAEVYFDIVNEGTADAWLKTTSDTERTTLDIPAGEQRTYGPFDWHSSLPYLHCETGASCRVTPSRRGHA